jgi:DNA-binding NtrC family response regulator
MTLPSALLVSYACTDASVRTALETLGWNVVVTTRVDEATGAAGAGCTFVVITCDSRSAAAAVAAAQTLRARDAELPIVLTVSGGSEAIAVAALRSGVNDYVPTPAAEGELRGVLARWRPRPPPPRNGERMMVGASAVIRQIGAYVQAVGGADTSVLITGETGTGKELVARLLHAHSPRRDRPFVAINCAAIPDTLLESELFGHERGAFTGAAAAREGHLRAAEGGTIMFDEIGEMSSFGQAKILRALDTREVYRLGSTRRLPLDVRVIAATNQDLPTLIGEGRFRRDLYYRLNVARVRLPPLRERREDIPALIDHYVRELNHRFQRSVEGFTAAALQEMVEYDWPGNVREVRNMVEGAFAELPHRDVTWLDTPAELRDRLRPTPAVSERDRLVAALVATNWNKSRAAERLHWSRMTLYRKLLKYNLQER